MKYVLQLFVAGSDPDSAEAFHRVRAMCEEHLAGRYRLWVIHPAIDPDAARNVARMPLLRRLEPPPQREWAGSFADPAAVFEALGIGWPPR